MAIKYFVYGIQVFDTSVGSPRFKDVLLFGSERMAGARAEQMNKKAAQQQATDVAIIRTIEEINVTKQQHDAIVRKRNGVWRSDVFATARRELGNKLAESEKLKTIANQEQAVANKKAAEITKAKQAISRRLAAAKRARDRG